MTQVAVRPVAQAPSPPLLPGLASLGPLRRARWPRLSGISALPHVALTFDDGPDPVSTPAFLDLLDAYDRRATFFVLGEHVAAHRQVVEDIAARGHELGVHGWDHRWVGRKRYPTLVADLARTSTAVSEISGRPVRWFRPPYGVLTRADLRAAHDTGLETVLWSAWGRDWESRATPASVVGTLSRTLAPGGTVLLHDSDRTSAPHSWLATLAATEVLLEGWAADGTDVGPLGDHWPVPVPVTTTQGSEV